MRRGVGETRSAELASGIIHPSRSFFAPRPNPSAAALTVSVTPASRLATVLGDGSRQCLERGLARHLAAPPPRAPETTRASPGALAQPDEPRCPLTREDDGRTIMTTSWKTLALATLLTLSTCPGTAKATSGIEASKSIPTMLVAMDEPTGYPDPICSKCKIIVVEEEGSAQQRAELRIEYPTDAPSFEGDVGVTVSLADGTRRTVWLSNVSLAPGAAVELVAEAGHDWAWDGVRFVWLQFEAM
jgi:hypothetical protein